MALGHLKWGSWNQETEFHFAANSNLLKREEPLLSLWMQVLKKTDLLGIYFIFKKLFSMLGVTRCTSKLECFMNVTYTMDFRLTLKITSLIIFMFITCCNDSMLGILG